MKNHIALAIVEYVLKEMEFNKEYELNYDPKGIIPQRRVQFGRSTFQHQQIPNLTKEANSLVYDFVWNVEGKTQASQEVHTQVLVTSIYSETELGKGRTISKVSDMDIEQQPSSKKPKVDKGKEVINLD